MSTAPASEQSNLKSYAAIGIALAALGINFGNPFNRDSTDADPIELRVRILERDVEELKEDMDRYPNRGATGSMRPGSTATAPK